MRSRLVRCFIFIAGLLGFTLLIGTVGFALIEGYSSSSWVSAQACKSSK